MHARPIILTSLGVLAVALACPGGGSSGKQDAQQAAAKEAADKKAADEHAEQEEAKRRAEARKLEEERSERAYQEAKGALEPLAKLPKKHPKGFGTACNAMLEQYSVFMNKALDADALAKWQSQSESRVPVMRRQCHQRPVEVVVCETQLLEKGPADADFDHIMRVCREKFG